MELDMYLIIENGEPTGFSNVAQSEHDVVVDSDKLYLEAYSVVNGAVVYDAAAPLASAVRRQRDAMIAQTDYTQLPDVPDTIRQAYIEYRQALRDITDQDGFPYNVAWPTKPEV